MKDYQKNQKNLNNRKINDNPFSHIDSCGNPGMVDVLDKKITRRSAHARTTVSLPEVIFQEIRDEEIASKKGPVFQTAIIAGTMAVKKTAQLIPLCHPLNIEKCHIEIRPLSESSGVEIDCYVSLDGKTGVEMEALVGASVAALTIYDMCKSISHRMVIEKTYLVEKKGGKSDGAKSPSDTFPTRRLS